MAEFLSLKKVTKTRKTHRCVGCGDLIEKSQSAWAWTSVDGSINTSHLHDVCGEEVHSICFSCRRCDDGDGYSEAFMWEATMSGVDCVPCNRLRKNEVER